MDSPIIKAPFIGGDGRPLIEPGAFYLDGNYTLRVNSWNALAGVTLTIRCRMIRASDGELVDSSWDHIPNTNRTKATNDFPLPQGFILNVTVFASVGAPLIGQTFVQVQLARGLTGATLLQATMLQDYVTAVQALAYPGSPIRSSIEGGGFYRDITGTTPAAGGEITETVPSGARWEVVAVLTTLTTTAVAGNRCPAIFASVSGHPTAASAWPTGVPASKSYVVSWARGTQGMVDVPNTRLLMPLPDGLVLLAGDNFHTSTGSIDVGDQFTAPNYIVREWLEAAA